MHLRGVSNDGNQFISIALCKTVVTPLLTHWSYCSLERSHRSVLFNLPYSADRCPHNQSDGSFCREIESISWYHLEIKANRYTRVWQTLKTGDRGLTMSLRNHCHSVQPFDVLANICLKYTMTDMTTSTIMLIIWDTQLLDFFWQHQSEFGSA